MVCQVENAIQNSYIQSADWATFKTLNDIDDSEGNANKCCIFIPLKKPLLKNTSHHTFMCVDLTTADKEAGRVCENIALSFS